MHDREYRKEVLDKLSPSFCGAKWYNATIWLGSGQTTSCHHPPAHSIDINLIKTNPKAIHNTDQKRDDRRKMKAGERPAGCEYCWKIEDMGREAVSDRVYKSRIYSIESLHEAYDTPSEQDVNLKTLEIAFDRTCQFACSYCNPAFSSSWVRDIRQHGPYFNLVSDGRNHFTHAHDGAQLYRFGETNPYVDAFFAWWESDLHLTLDELRITGGEPLMSGHTWKLIDWFVKNPGRSRTRLAINSNLGTDVDVNRLVRSVDGLTVDLYTSNESYKEQSEYIRDGLDWVTWTNNLDQVLSSNKFRRIHIMSTINALCLDSLDKFLDFVIEQKIKHGLNKLSFTLNILRFPSFQSPLVLSEELKNIYRNRLTEFLVKHKGHNYLEEHETMHILRLIDYLDVVKTPHLGAAEQEVLQHDFKTFYQQYDHRRNKNFCNTFPSLDNWFNSL